MRLWAQAIGLHQAVGAEFQGSAGGHGAVQLAQRSRCCIARVRVGFQALLDLALVQGLKTITRHEHFAAHLQEGRVIATQLQRDVAYRTHGVGDIFTGIAVTTGSPKVQDAIDVDQRGGQAVVLGLLRILQLGFAEFDCDDLFELMEIRVFEGVVQTQHAHRMGDRFQSANGDVAAHLCVGESGVSCEGSATSIALSS